MLFLIRILNSDIFSYVLPSTYPTDPFTILEPQNPSIVKLHVVPKLRSKENCEKASRVFHIWHES